VKIGLSLGGAAVSWRAEDSDAAGVLRLKMLEASVGMETFPDDGKATCRIIPCADFDPKRGVGIPRHGMRVDFTGAAERGAEVVFSDGAAAPGELEVTRWRGVRKLLFLGLVPRMLKLDCSMVHGALMAKNGRGVLLCGPSGMGKSTTAGRMKTEGFEVLADDCFLLRRSADDGYFARPLPTWSIYLFGKTALAECDARREIPVSHLFILGRSVERYTQLDAQTALLGCANAFTDMVQWHTFRYPAELAAALTDRALAAAERLVRELPCGALQLTLDCGISRLLPDL
jgi:hypothetical protein